MDEIKKWFVIKTKSKSEKKVAERFNKINITSYLPLYTSIRIWSDRKKKIKLPLISGVVFVNEYENKLNNLYATEGVIGILKHLNKPAIVKDYEINNLKIILNEEFDFETGNLSLINKGQLVEVIEGPFTGMIGYAIKTSRKFKISIEMKSVNFRFLIDIHNNSVRKINDENQIKAKL